MKALAFCGLQFIKSLANTRWLPAGGTYHEEPLASGQIYPQPLAQCDPAGTPHHVPSSAGAVLSLPTSPELSSWVLPTLWLSLCMSQTSSRRDTSSWCPRGWGSSARAAQT